jgi:hypothetical protein
LLALLVLARLPHRTGRGYDLQAHQRIPAHPEHLAGHDRLVPAPLKSPTRSADQWFMPTEPIIIILDSSFLAWLFCAVE